MSDSPCDHSPSIVKIECEGDMLQLKITVKDQFHYIANISYL